MSVVIERLLAGTVDGRPLSIAGHTAVHGQLPLLAAAELVREVGTSQLAGRGGAGFPAARKLAAIVAASGPKVVIANGSESEPMAEKDRVLLELTPHLVLDGLEIVARAAGARTAMIALGSRSEQAVRAVERAIAERGGLRPRLVRLPSHYLAGQETALISYAGGGALKPRTVPPLPIERGLKRRPTLVQNVETLAHIALIARHGSAWFRAAGSEESPGTILVTLAGAVAIPGVYEVHGGARVGDVIDVAGGTTDELRGLLVGGYFGRWFGADGLDLHLDAARLARHGGSLGSGVVVALGASACPVAEVAHVTAWLASQSAGQCGPCTFGLPAIADALESVVRGRSDGHSRERIRRWGGMVERRGACHHPDGVARFVLSAMEVFHAEFRDHERRGPCTLCTKLPTLIVPHALRRAA